MSFFQSFSHGEKHGFIGEVISKQESHGSKFLKSHVLNEISKEIDNAIEDAHEDEDEEEIVLIDTDQKQKQVPKSPKNKTKEKVTSKQPPPPPPKPSERTKSGFGVKFKVLPTPSSPLTKKTKVEYPTKQEKGPSIKVSAPRNIKAGITKKKLLQTRETGFLSIDRNKWKKRFFKINKSLLEWSKWDAKTKDVEGRIDLSKFQPRKDVPFKNQLFIIALVPILKDDEKRVFYIAVESETVLNDWITIFDQLYKGYEREAVVIREKDVVEINNQIQEILNEYHFTSKIDKAIQRGKGLFHKYKVSSKVALLLSNLYMKKGEIKEAISYLNRKVIHYFYKGRVNLLHDEEKKTQFRLNFEMMKLYLMLFGKKHKLKYSQYALIYCKNCERILKSRVDVAENFGMIYDNLKMYDKSSLIWKGLIDTNPEHESYYIKYIGTFKRTKQKDKLLKYLMKLDEKEIRLPVVYKELSSLLRRNLKKESNRKLEFYNWIPKFLKKIKYSEVNYEIYKRIDGNINKNKIIFIKKELIKKKTSDTTEFLFCLLYHYELSQSNSYKPSRELKEGIGIILTEIQKRLGKEKLLITLCVKLFSCCSSPLLMNKLVPIIIERHILKKNHEPKDLYFEFFDHLTKVLTFEESTVSIKIFEFFILFKDPNCVPYLINMVKYGKSLTFKRLCVLNLIHFITDGNKRIIRNFAEKLYKNQDNDEFRIHGSLVLYKITNDKTFLQILTTIKKIHIHVYKTLKHLKGTEIYVKNFKKKTFQ